MMETFYHQEKGEYITVSKETWQEMENLVKTKEVKFYFEAYDKLNKNALTRYI